MVHPTSPILLTRLSPIDIYIDTTNSYLLSYTLSQFANSYINTFVYKNSKHKLYCMQLCLYYLLSWGKLRGEPATRWFDWSFAPILNFYKQSVTQKNYEPPSKFLKTSNLFKSSSPSIGSKHACFYKQIKKKDYCNKKIIFRARLQTN